METKEYLELQNLGLSSLLIKHRNAAEKKEYNTCKNIEEIIEENFTEKPWVKYKTAKAELEKLMDGVPKEIIESLLLCKQCAADIIDHLDPIHVDGFPSLETLINGFLVKYKEEHGQAKVTS